MQRNINVSDRLFTLTDGKTLTGLANALRARGFEVNMQPSGWRCMMFRRSEAQWTQGYRNAKSTVRIRFAGPEVQILDEITGAS